MIKLQPTKAKYKQTFRFYDNPKLIVWGVLSPPVQEASRNLNSIVRLLDVGKKALSIEGKVLVQVAENQTMYLCGKQIEQLKSTKFRLYEVTHPCVTVVAQNKSLHPITKLETGKLIYTERLNNLPITLDWDDDAPRRGDNPIQGGYIYSTEQLYAGEVVDGQYLIREVKPLLGLWQSRFEFRVVKNPYGES